MKLLRGLCAYVCMYVYIYVCIYVCMNEFLYECSLYTYMCMYTNTKGKVMDMAGQEEGSGRKRHGRVKADKLM